MSETKDRPSDPGPPHRRRPRYAGTHPRGFGERYKEHDPDRWPDMQEHVRGQGRTPAGSHVPVMLEEVLRALDPRPGEAVADGTVGHGGHARAFLRRIAPGGRFVGLDVDAATLADVAARLDAPGASASFHRSSFAGLGKILAAEGLDGFDVIFADLGVSSMQLDDPARGFSYKHDGPLDMRMDDRLPRTAADLLRDLSVPDLSAALRDLADEPRHAAIAKAIGARRAVRPLARTSELARLVMEVAGVDPAGRRAAARANPRALHPAARTFQALRMLVNDEIGQLEQFLRVAPYCLRPGGRIGVLSFHCGEDDRVAAAFAAGAAAGVYEAFLETPERPGRDERRDNPRSASALFRWARRGPASGAILDRP